MAGADNSSVLTRHSLARLGIPLAAVEEDDGDDGVDDNDEEMVMRKKSKHVHEPHVL